VIVHSKVKDHIPVVLVKKILTQAAAHFKQPLIGEISIIFVGDQAMRRLNRQYRGKDKTTNVLSFTSNYKLLTTNYKLVDLGDIFICYPEAKREAKKYHFTLRQELDRLLVHGFLHLMGYDHQTDREAKKMEKLEDTLCLV